MMVPRKLSLDLGAVPTLFRCINSPAFVRIALGPVGSGKSTVMCGEIMRLAQLTAFDASRPGSSETPTAS